MHRSLTSLVRPSVLAVLVALLGLLPGERAHAQLPVAFGGQVSFADDTDVGIGARVLVGTGTMMPNTRFVGSFDLYFPASQSQDFPGVGTVTADPSYWEVNLNGHLTFPLEKTPFDLYVGTGLHYYDGSVDVSVAGLEVRGFDPDGSGLGVNVLGGIEFSPAPMLTTFGELKIEIGGAEQVIFSVGAWF